jgi:protein-serine/threonine kinase
MDHNNASNNNRPVLNFSYNDRQYNQGNNRAFPTTPSSFPQPMYSNQGGGQEYVDSHGAHGGQNMYNQGYFVNNPYAAHPQQQQQQYAMGPGMGAAPPQQQPQQVYQSRGPYQANDPTNGLIQQFSNHDLGSPRPQNYGGRNPPPTGGRPRTGGAQAAVQAHLAPPGASRGSVSSGEDEELPKYLARYSEPVHKRGKVAKELVSVFFRESIERARDRNVR